MKQIAINPNNRKYYSEDFIKGFQCGAQRQFEADKADRPQEWIPCSERLPNEGEVVLVCMRIESHKAEWEEQRSIEFGRISSDRYDFNGTGWEWLNESGADYWQADWNNSILAWMPLPKPWKGADDE